MLHGRGQKGAVRRRLAARAPANGRWPKCCTGVGKRVKANGRGCRTHTSSACRLPHRPIQMSGQTPCDADRPAGHDSHRPPAPRVLGGPLDPKRGFAATPGELRARYYTGVGTNRCCVPSFGLRAPAKGRTSAGKRAPAKMLHGRRQTGEGKRAWAPDTNFKCLPFTSQADSNVRTDTMRRGPTSRT